MANKSADVTLADAQQELISINARLSDASARRDQLLLAGNEAELDQIARHRSDRFRVAATGELQRDVLRGHGGDFAIIRRKLRRNRRPRMMS